MIKAYFSFVISCADKYRTLSHAAVVFLLCCLLALSGCDSPRHLPLPVGSTVLAFGDSITYGTGAGRANAYPAVLAGRTGWRVINAGVPGETSEQALARIDQLLARHTPDLVIIELGGNDFLQKRSAAAIKADLQTIIGAVKVRSIPVAMIAVPGFSVFGATLGRLSDAPLYDELAREEEIILIDSALSKILSDKELTVDPVHPNAEGYRILAEAVAQRLVKSGLLER